MVWGAPRILGAISGTIAYSVGQWILVVLIARVGSVEMLGEYAFALAVTAPIFMLSNLRLRFVLASDHDQTPFADFLKLRLILTGIAVIVAVGIGFEVATSSVGFGVVLAITAFKAAEAVGDIGLGLFQAREKMLLAGRAYWLLTAISLSAFGGALILSGSLILACVAMACGRVGLLYVYEVPRWRDIEEERNGDGAAAVTPIEAWCSAPNSRVLALFKRAWPLGGSAVLDSLNTNIPRYFALSISGAAGLGAFAAMTTLSQGVFLLVNSVAQVKLPALARTAVSGQRSRFWRDLAGMATTGLAIGVAGVLIAWMGGESILRVVFGEGFLRDANAFVPIMLGGLCSVLALVGTYALTALGDYRFQFVGYLACSLAIIVFCGTIAQGGELVDLAIALAKAQLIHVVVAGSLILALARRRVG